MGRRSTGTVEVRESGLRLRFTHAGERQTERLELKPTPANIKAAERLLARIRIALEAGVYRRDDFFDSPARKTSILTFGDYADSWLETLVLAKSTKRLYGNMLRNTWKPALGELILTQVKQSDIRKVVAARAEQVKPGVINSALTVAREIFSLAEADGLIQRNPMNGVKNLKVQKTEPDPFTAEERELILSWIKERQEQIWNYYETAFFTGVRPSEQIALKWSAVDWRRRKLKIEAAIVEGEEKVTKTSRIREIDINDRALAALTRQKTHTFMKGADAPVFSNPVTNQPWNDIHSQREVYFKPALRALGIRHRDAYQTRHTFATALLMGGVNPAYISKQLGHASLAMLFDVYGTWLEAADGGLQARKANEVLTRALSTEPTSPNATTSSAQVDGSGTARIAGPAPTPIE